MELIKRDDLLNAVGEENGELWTVKGIKTMIDSLPTFSREELRCGGCKTEQDAISRQAAIDALMEILDRPNHAEFLYTDEICNTLSTLPSVQPEQQWIPCSERLPEIGQSVLLSVGGMYSAEGCLREDGDWAQFRWDAIQRKDMVGAWMPLPEPYKGEQP